MKDKEQLIQLLVGLNDVYKGVRGNILISRPLPNVSEIYYMLLQEEHQREMSSEVHMVPQSAALYNSSHHSQESLDLMGKNPGYNSLGKTNGYRGKLSGNNGCSHCPSSEMTVILTMVATLILKTQLLGDNYFVTTASLQDIQFRSATSCMGIHPGTGCIEVKEWQHLSLKSKKEFLG